MSESFTRILSPFQIGPVKLKNRMMSPAHTSFFASEEGFVTDTMLASYDALAKGGIGLIVMEFSSVDYPMGVDGFRQLGISDDKYLPGLSKLSETIHKHDCPVFMQLGHSGPAQPQKTLLGKDRVSASALTEEERPPAVPGGNFGPAAEMTHAEIKEMSARFARGAARAKKAGFDGVELHGGHPYLINSFLSGIWNKRQDEYGCQNLENRARFAVETIKAVKETVGKDFPVGIRVNGAEYGYPGAITPREGQAFARMFRDAGIDYISVTAYGFGAYLWLNYPDQLQYPEPNPEVVPFVKDLKRGSLVTFAEGIKKATGLPVITVGRLGPDIGEQVLRENRADLIGMVRRVMADPELPKKIAEGRPEDITPCMGCVECSSKFVKEESIRCRVNAALGRELEYTIEPARKKKRVMVIGGGPAGMEAARVAALKGHGVTLYEKEHGLGGLLPVAALVKGLEVEDLCGLTRYYRTQLDKLGVAVKLGQEVTPALIVENHPDAVILAAGGIPSAPDIPGADSPILMKSSDLHKKVKPFLRLFNPGMLNRLTRFWMPVGKNVVVMGGLIAGCQLAEFLAKRGRNVVIVEESEDLGDGIPLRNKPRLINWLAKKGVTMLGGVKYERITEKGLEITTKEGQKRFFAADTIISAVPFKPNNALFQAVQGKVPEVYQIGDCAEPRKIIDAIDDGFRIARAI